MKGRLKWESCYSRSNIFLRVLASYGRLQFLLVLIVAKNIDVISPGMIAGVE